MMTLEANLKTLRLGGMLDTLELRLKEAQRDKLGYLEFLEMLLEDEISRRGQKALTRTLAQARFEEVKTLAEFDFRFNPKIHEPVIRDLATLGFLERAESVILCGPVDVGKSHVAQALGYLACQVRYVKTGRFLADLGDGHADGTWEQRLRGYLRAEFLILDDFGLRNLTRQQSEDLYELLAERYRKSSTIVVSNRPAKNWYDLFANPVLAESVLDRLVNSSHHVLMEGRSYRSVTRPGSHQPPEEGRGSDQPS